jgi:hypothetical protein
VISPFASILQLKPCVSSSLVAMDRAAVDEIVALKAEVASLKLHNESLEIRLAAANDKIVSLQQFLEGETHMRRTAQAALEAANNGAVENEALKAEAKRLKEENFRFQLQVESYQESLDLATKTLRRVCPHLVAPGKVLQPAWTKTAFAALDLVKHWDRDECVADLKRQNAEHLKMIAVLKSGRELMMDDVVKAMNEDNGNLRMLEDFQASLQYVLSEIREQLRAIYETLDPESAHEEWFKYPLSMFTLIANSENSDMEDDESMEE